MTVFRQRLVKLQAGTLLVERNEDGGRPLNVDVDVVRTIDRTPNTATIKIYNLNETHRRQVEALKETDVVALSLGHETTGLFEAYRGTVRLAWTVRADADLITTIDAIDGDAESVARFSRSYTKGTKLSTILRDIVRAAGMKPGNLDAILEREPGLANAKLETGVSMYGESARLMAEMLEPAGLANSIQNGILQIVDAKAGLGGTAVLLSAGSGLIGSPSVALEDKTRLVTCEALIQADLEPGRQVKIESIGVNGQFVIRRTQYTGSLDGDTFSAALELRAA